MDNGCTAVCLGRSMVREDLPYMADIFRASGYQTAHFGKWHMGDSYPYRPEDRGSDENISHGAWGSGPLPIISERLTGRENFTTMANTSLR